MRRGIEEFVSQIIIISGVIVLGLLIFSFYHSYVNTVTKDASEKNIECNVSSFEAQQLSIKSIHYYSSQQSQTLFSPQNKNAINLTFNSGGEIIVQNITLPKNIVVLSATMKVQGYKVS